MIKIEIQRQKNKIIYFEIKGHANFSEYGEDVICAAVSSVGQMTVNGLIETLKLKKKMKFIEEDGYIECDLVESMYSYLKEVAKSYSNFVKLKVIKK